MFGRPGTEGGLGGRGGRRLWLPAAAAAADFAAVVLGAWLAYAVRFGDWLSPWVTAPASLPPAAWYFRLSLVLAGVTFLVMAWDGMYRIPSQLGWGEELRATLRNFFISWTVVLAGLFFYREVGFSRMTMAFLFGFGAAGLAVSRSSGRWLRGTLHRSGRAVKRVAMVGSGRQADRLVEHLQAHSEFGLEVAGRLDGAEGEPGALPALGTVEEVRTAIMKHKLDTLLIVPSAGEADLMSRLITACYGVNVEFLFVPGVLLTGGRPRRIVRVGGVPLWVLKETPYAGWSAVVKRAFDLVVGGLMLVAALPVMALTTVAIKLDTPGPVFYRQRRVSLDGREFNLLKFRSMHVGAEDQTGAVWAVRNDPRTTRVGRFIRRWKIDELPQLFNVLKGDMSLVGPRPERPEFVREFERRITGYHERHRVRAGLTGWAQVNEKDGYSPIEYRTKFDLQYVENWSLWFDLKILWRTLVIIIKGETSN